MPMVALTRPRRRTQMPVMTSPTAVPDPSGAEDGLRPFPSSRLSRKSGHDRPHRSVRHAHAACAMGDHAAASLWRVPRRPRARLPAVVLCRHDEAEEDTCGGAATGHGAAGLSGGSVIKLRRHLLAVALRLVVVDP